MPACRPQSHHGSHGGETTRVRAALRPAPATYPATPVVSCCRNRGGAPGFLEAQIDHLDELIVPLVTTRPGPVHPVLVMPPPWSCA
jgi:hypothetical protein